MYEREKAIRDPRDHEAFKLYTRAKESTDVELEEKAFEMSPLLESMVYNY